jgi:hypothetical protein
MRMYTRLVGLVKNARTPLPFSPLAEREQATRHNWWCSLGIGDPKPVFIIDTGGVEQWISLSNNFSVYKPLISGE